MAWKSMTFIIAALLILSVPGLLYNNLNNNHLVVSQSKGLTCSTDPETPTCQISGSVGCQNDTTVCNLSGSSISFLNNCSPFTNILTLNYIGFISSFFTSCSNAVISATNQNPFSQNITLSKVFGGNETIAGLVPNFGKHDVSISSGQSQWNTSSYPSPVRTGVHLPIVLTCLGWQVTGYHLYTGSAWRTGTQLAQCTYIDSTKPSPIVLATLCQLFGNSTDVNNAICTNFSPGNNGFTNTGGSGLNVGSVISFALSLLGVAMLIFLGLGLGVSAVSVSFDPNRQGTKFVQVLGIGLIIWFPLYSEFSGWFTSGILPYGFDGVAGIVSVALIAMMFFGLYQQGTQD